MPLAVSDGLTAAARKAIFCCLLPLILPQIIFFQFSIERCPLADTELTCGFLAVAVATFQGLEDIVFFDFFAERLAHQRVDTGSSRRPRRLR